MRCLILDLEGTTVETRSGLLYPLDKNDYYFLEGVLEKIYFYYSQHWEVCIITNQDEINQGLVKPNVAFERINNVIQDIELYLSDLNHNRPIHKVIGLHANHKYHKPKVQGLIDLNEKMNNQINFENSLYIGNSSENVFRVINSEFRINSYFKSRSEYKQIHEHFMNQAIQTYQLFGEREVYVLNNNQYPNFAGFSIKKNNDIALGFYINTGNEDIQLANELNIEYKDIDRWLKKREYTLLDQQLGG